MRTTKKALSIVLAGLMTVGGMSVFSVSAAQTSTPTLSFKTQNALYAHAVSGSDDSDAWVAWQCKHNEDMEELNTNRKYFFLPSSVSSTSVELYNAYSKSVTVNNVTNRQASRGRFRTQLIRQAMLLPTEKPIPSHSESPLPSLQSM